MAKWYGGKSTKTFALITERNKMKIAGDVTGFPKPKTYKNNMYLAMVRRRPCLVCGSKIVDVHHVSFHDAGFGKKSGDLTTISLCREHHGLLHTDPKRFSELVGREEIYEEIIANLKSWIEGEA